MKNIICTVLAGALACQQASAFVSTSAASSKSNENNKQMMSTSSSSALSSMSYNQNFYNNGNRMIGTSSSSALSMSYNQNFYNNGNRMIGNMNNYGAYQNYNMGMMGGGSYIYDPAMTKFEGGQDEYGNLMDQNQYNRPRPGLIDPYRGGSTMGSSGKGVWVGPSYDEMSMRNRAGYGMMNQGPYSYNQGMMNPYYGGGYGYGQGGMMNQGMYGGGYYGNQGMYPGGYYNNRMLPPGRY